MPSRDVEINLIGHDRTGRATRSAANNLDQLARKVESFNAKTIGNKDATVKTKVDNSAATRAAGKLKASFAKAGDEAGTAFASRFRRKVSSMVERVRLKVRVDTDDSIFEGIGKRFSRGLGRAMASVVNDGSRAIGNAIRLMALKAPQVAGPAILFVGARLAGLLGQALTAGFAGVLGPALLAGPIAFLLAQGAKASKETQKQEKVVAALRKRLNNAATKDTRERLAKQLAGEERVLADMRKQSQQWDNIKAKAKAFMTFISAPLKIPLQQSIDEVFKGLDRLKGPVRGIMTALGTALPGFTKGVMDTFLNFIKALQPALPGIVAGMRAWGKELPKIGAAFGNMIAKIMANPDQVVTAVQNISQVLQSLASGTGTIISGLTRLGNAFFAFETNIDALENKNLGGLTSAFGGAFRQVTSVIYQEVIQWLTLLFRFTSAWAKLNPALRPVAAAIGNTLAKVSTDFANMKNQWFLTDEAIRRRKIQAKITANIADLKTKLAEAKAKLNDPKLSKGKKIAIKADIADLRLKIATARAQKAALAKKPSISKLKATAKDLEAKIRSARASLTGVHNKKTIAKIKGDIRDAQAKLRQVKAQIASVKGKTVTVGVRITVSGRGAAAQQIAWVRRQAAIRASADGSWQGSGGPSWQGALAGGSTSRTAPPTVNIGDTNVNTRVFVDGNEIRAVVRQTIQDENSRAAHKARVGRR